MVAASGRKITLRCADGKCFEGDEAKLASNSQTIRLMIKHGRIPESGISLPRHISSEAIQKVISYCDLHDKTVVDTIYDKAKLSDLIMAANYLEIKGLLNLASQAAEKCMTDEEKKEQQKKDLKEDFIFVFGMLATAIFFFICFVDLWRVMFPRNQ